MSGYHPRFLFEEDYWCDVLKVVRGVGKPSVLASWTGISLKSYSTGESDEESVFLLAVKIAVLLVQ